MQFIRGDLVTLLKDVDPTVWQILTESKKIQMPALNITLLDQHYKKLETVSSVFVFFSTNMPISRVLEASP